jgi:hypothetical protein
LKVENTRSIEIDFEVHQKIELERTSFEELPNEALRRLLGLVSKKQIAQGVNADDNVQVGRSWSGKGVTLPHSTELKMEYNGSVYQGTIQDGIWMVEGAKCKSPSDAAGAVAKTRGGRTASLNGWIYWQVKRPTDRKWVRIDALRK